MGLRSYQIAIIGDKDVGKTCLDCQFNLRHFVGNPEPMISQSMRRQVFLNSQVYILETSDWFWSKPKGDEEKQPYMQAIPPISQYEGDYGSAGILLVYSVISRETFKEVRAIYDKIRQEEVAEPSPSSAPPLPVPSSSSKHGKELKKRRHPIPIVLVGNKADARVIDGDGEVENEQVTYSEGDDLAKELGCVSFFEVSAKTAMNVDRAFHSLVGAISRDEDMNCGTDAARVKGVKEENQVKHRRSGSMPTALRRWGD